MDAKRRRKRGFCQGFGLRNGKASRRENAKGFAMVQVLASSWALLLGLMLLMVGNGLQGTLLGVRGELEGFTTFELSIVMSAYFLGFLGGSKMAPELIRRVGHVRVFAALASFISAVLILYATWANPWVWISASSAAS